ncbi:MAG: putative DNA binding domain-containing protein [Muribaculaceae bacterium]|nr:putative DNA binding domain-containing protein [Muribaculaceae bacterium]
MALPINIEDLLNKRKVESNRIEFKASWNPDKIYHTICAFATDLENTGGGYILVGVEEENGVAKRPVKGIDETELDKILKDMVGYDAKISPSYICKVSPEEVDGKTILAIWVPTGINRPYSVMESVVARKSVPKFYIRSKSSTIEAKGELLDEVRELANRIPFDDRGNEKITIDDISGIRVYEHLKAVGSKLVDEFGRKTLLEILDEMDLLVGPIENRQIKNVAAMMFCDNPEKFFPVTQVDIVHFPDGSIENPDVMIETPKITGPIPKIINETLSYLRTNVIKQRIIKPSDSEKSIKVFNYPYQAFEEAVVNALYHRDYMEREPVEITIEPTHIDILSYAGPDRSISAQAIKEAKKLKARRYRNRRLGDFLKELGLTEGRATGIPTIQKHLKFNGNAPATIETDDDRTYFLMTIPCREDMIGQNDIEAVNKTDNKITHLSEIKRRLKNELVNDDLQVYIDINEDVNHLIDKLANVILQVYLQVWENTSVNQSAMIADVLRMFISIKTKSQTLSELLKLSNMESLYKLRRYILEPAISAGYIEMSNPEKPTSSKQRYLLTELASNLFNQ